MSELCQVYNALLTALRPVKEGSKVLIFFGSRGINVCILKDKVNQLKCSCLICQKRLAMRDEEDGRDESAVRSRSLYNGDS